MFSYKCTLRPMGCCRIYEGTKKCWLGLHEYTGWSSTLLFAHEISRNVSNRTIWHVCPTKTQIGLHIRTDWSETSLFACITKTCLYNFDPLKPHLYIVKLGFTGVYLIFLISAWNIDCGRVFVRTASSRRFHFLVVKFSVYLNRHVFVMNKLCILG